MDDKELMELLYLTRCGNTLAQEDLFRGFYRVMTKMVHRYALVCSCDTDHEELTQMAMVVLADVVYSYTPGRGAKFVTYALACARRRLSKHLRRLQERNRYMQTKRSLDRPATKDGKQKLVDLVRDDTCEYNGKPRAQMTLVLEDTLGETAARLSPRERDVLMLSRQGYAKKDIAVTLSMNIKSVYNFYHRALTKLRRTSGETPY